MKKFAIVFIGLIGIGMAVLAVKGQEMQEIRTEVEIAAPPEKVWSVLMDIGRWQEWSPIIKSSEGSPEVGSKLDITMVGKGEKAGPRYQPRVEEMNSPRFFRWRAYMMAPFLFTNDKVFELEATSNGTRLVHKELFKGLLAPVFCGQMEKGVPPMLDSMNQALKMLVEQR